MDKFGIFNLLNSFLNFYQQKKSDSGEQPSANSDALNSLFSSLGGKKEQATPSVSEKKSASPIPLQASMLATMQTHDEFIKRVQSKNKPPQK